MIYDFFPRAIIPNPHRSMDPYDVQFCITNALRFLSSTRLVGVLLCLSLLATSSPSMYAFYWRSVGISTCLLSRFIAMMQMRVCKDRMALGLYL